MILFLFLSFDCSEIEIDKTTCPSSEARGIKLPSSQRYRFYLYYIIIIIIIDPLLLSISPFILLYENRGAVLINGFPEYLLTS